MSSRAVAAAALCLLLSSQTGCLFGASAERPDPYEPLNRGVFGFNERLDQFVLEPGATGWTWITPKGFRVGLDKFFRNLRFPVRFLANLGQGRVRRAGSEVARFVANTTVGLLGFFDPATHWGWRLHKDDFGLMFGRWGVPSGPYWMLPFFGPSNPRDSMGLALEFPLRMLLQLPVGVQLAATATNSVNSRAIAAPTYDTAREAALDLYVFVRDSAIQQRRALVREEDFLDFQPQGGEADDFYDVPDDLYGLDEDLDSSEPGEAPAKEKAHATP